MLTPPQMKLTEANGKIATEYQDVYHIQSHFG